MKKHCVKPDTFEHKLPTQPIAAICERPNMKRCTSCDGPVLNATGVCGRCNPPMAAVENAIGITEQTGRNGSFESLAGDMTHFQDAAPVIRSIDLTATTLEVAQLMAAEISGHRFNYATGREGRFWPSAEDTHVNYRGKTVGGII